MFQNLEIFSMAQGLAQHANARQTTVAANLANANTPGYRGRDIESFADSYRRRPESMPLARTRAAHRRGLAEGLTARSEVVRDAVSGPNGNTVTVETEMMKAAEIRQQHQTALTIYKSSLTMLRTSLGQR